MANISIKKGSYANKANLEDGDIGFAQYNDNTGTIVVNNNGTLFNLMPAPGASTDAGKPLISQGEDKNGNSLSPIYDTLGVKGGGTGRATLTSGRVLIGNGTGAVDLRSITDNTSSSSIKYISATSNLITANTLAYWNGAYSSAGSSRITKVGTIDKGSWKATPIAIAYGGTGATTAAAARTNLGITPANIGAAALDENGKVLTSQLPIHAVGSYGICETAGDVATKEIVVDDNSAPFTLQPGAIITIKFSSTNTAASPKFKIGHKKSDGTITYSEEKPVFYNTTNLTTTNLDRAGYASRYIHYVYDGEKFIYKDWSYKTRVAPQEGFVYIRDHSAPDANNIISATVGNYKYTAHSYITMNFETDVPANARLNIDDTGARYIQYQGEKIKDGVIHAGDIVTFLTYGRLYIVISIDKQAYRQLSTFTTDVDLTWYTIAESTIGAKIGSVMGTFEVRAEGEESSSVSTFIAGINNSNYPSITQTFHNQTGPKGIRRVRIVYSSDLEENQAYLQILSGPCEKDVTIKLTEGFGWTLVKTPYVGVDETEEGFTSAQIYLSHNSLVADYIDTNGLYTEGGITTGAYADNYLYGSVTFGQWDPDNDSVEFTCPVCFDDGLEVYGDVSLDTPLSIANGGTGATTAADARANLGITPSNIGAAPASHTHSYAGSSAVGGAANSSNKLELFDTRKINEKPSEVIEKINSKGIRFDFKENSVMGISDEGTYSTIQNIRQWTDKSGGKSTQIAYSDSGAIRMRKGDMNTDTWGSWKTVAYTDSDITGAVNRTYLSDSIYNPTKGVLIDFNIKEKSGNMIILKLSGNSYSSGKEPIEAIYQFYDNAGGGLNSWYAGTTLSGPAIDLKIFRVNNKLKAWFQHPSVSCTFKVEVTYGQASKVIPKITLSDDVEPTVAVSVNTTVTIVPKKVFSSVSTLAQNRLLTRSGDYIVATNNYIADGKLAIGSASTPNENLYVNGTSKITGAATVKTLTISDAAGSSHIKFSRNNNGINYLHVPTGGQLGVCIGDELSAANCSFVVKNDIVFPYKTNTIGLGSADNKWKHLYVGAGGIYTSSTIYPTTQNGCNIGTASYIWKYMYGERYYTYDATNKYQGGCFYTANSTSTESQPTYLILGNETATGTAGNRYGVLKLYGTGTNYTIIQRPAETTDGNYTLNLPGGNGQLVYHTNDTQIGDTNLPVYVNAGGAVRPVTSVGEGFLSWGGKNQSTSFGPVDAGLSPLLGSNRFAYGNPSGVVVEYSRNGGSTWTDYGLTAQQKTTLISPGLGAVSIVAGKGTTTDNANKANSDKYQVRVILTAATLPSYTSLNKFIINVSTEGFSGNWCTVEIEKNSTWRIVANKVPIGGWSGYNVINVPQFVFDSRANQANRIRLTFGGVGDPAYSSSTGLQIFSIAGFGGMGWTCPSDLAKKGTVYTTSILAENDSYANGKPMLSTTFPGKLSAIINISSKSFDAKGNQENQIRVWHSENETDALYLFGNQDGRRGLYDMDIGSIISIGPDYVNFNSYRSAGSQWARGREVAPFRSTFVPDRTFNSWSAFFPILSKKTKLGSWEAGCLMPGTNDYNANNTYNAGSWSSAEHNKLFHEAFHFVHTYDDTYTSNTHTVPLRIFGNGLVQAQKLGVTAAGGYGTGNPPTGTTGDPLFVGQLYFKIIE